MTRRCHVTWSGHKALYAPEVWGGLLLQRAFAQLTDMPNGPVWLGGEGGRGEDRPVRAGKEH